MTTHMELDSEQADDFSEENPCHLNVDVTDSDEDQYRMVITGQNVHDFLPFPPFSKRKEEMEIKDVVKDYVLFFLPAKSLVRFRSVSKDWDNWIRSPFLAHQQSHSFQDLSGYFCQGDYDVPTFVTLDHASYGVPSPSLEFLPGPVDIQSSTNGLLLCQGCTEDNTYYVCNPVNKKWMELPQPRYYHGSELAAPVLVFEPDVINMGADYVVICAVSLLDQSIIHFELYSSKTMSWRPLDAICAEFGNPSFVGAGFYMKGIAYWQMSEGNVLAFNIEHKFYGIISLPQGRPPGGILAKIHNELAYIGVSNYFGNNEYRLQIYAGADLSLRRTIDIQLEPGRGGINEYRVLPSGNSDIVMILCGSLIYSYSLRTQRVEVVTKVEGVDDLATTRFLPYVNSLVSVAFV